ncbi:MAG: hypothetical protein K6T39_11650 [Anoxybacillus ayderensis]|nr:hypothetical protein [Anoxybacillus ayderensis]
MKVDDKSMRLHWLYNEANKILQNEKATAEELEQADKYIAEAVGIKADLDAARQRQEKMKM